MMNSEERILEMLTAISGRLDKLETTMATKEDLAVISTRMDKLEATMATKEDLLGMATKEDLVPMATKEDLDRVLVESKIMQESYFSRKFNLLAEEVQLIRAKMLPMEAIESAEDRLDVLEAVVKTHSAEIRKLKKAQ